MKSIIEIHKLLWTANLVLLAILGYVVASFILSDDAKQSTTADLTPKTANGEFILRRDSLPSGNHKIILERNIFDPVGISTTKKNPQKEKKEAPAPVIRKQLQLRLLATVAGDEEVAS